MKRKHTEEEKKKISESMKGNHNRLGYKTTEETLQLNARINKDKVVYNDGEHNRFLMIGEEIPEGFTRGVLLSEEDRESRSERYKAINERRWHNGTEEERSDTADSAEGN